MHRSSPHAAPLPERLLPAWLFSLLFHFGVVMLLALAVHQAPRGAADEPTRSAGIVLKATSAMGDLYEGEDELAEDAQVAEQAPPADLLSVLPNEMAASGSDSPQDPAPGPGSEAAGGGQPDAGQFTAGGAARRGSPTGDSQARVTVFGLEGTGTKFVYLFDRSGSMHGAPLAAAKRQLIESLNSLDSVHQFHIIFFNHQVKHFDIAGGGRRIAFATERNKQLAANFVGGITAGGGTDRYLGLMEAIKFSPDVIFFLTDADDPMPASELAAIAQANRRARAAICVIEFGERASPAANNSLARLAEENGGQYGYVNVNQLGR